MKLLTIIPTFHHTTIRNQRGAMFGLDARIALAIFSVISIIAGATIVVNMDQSRAKSLASEMVDMAKAVEAIHADLRGDIFPALEQASEKNAFIALYDNTVVMENGNLRARWLGPYIKYTSNLHPRYGTMLLQARSAQFAQPCSGADNCYIWLVYSTIKPGIGKEVNDILDGSAEAEPSASGRLQWITDSQSGQDTLVLALRATKTLSYAGE